MTQGEFPSFPDGLMRHIAGVIAQHNNTQGVLAILKESGAREVPPGSKHGMLFVVFKQYNDEPNGQKRILKIIENFCDPTDWIGRPGDYAGVLDSINQGLVYVNLQVTQQGKITTSEKPTNAKIKWSPEMVIRCIQERKFSHEITGQPEQANVAPATMSESIMAQPSASQEAMKTSNQSPQESKPGTREMPVSPIFNARELSCEQDLCFVLMPFQPPFDRLYKETIRPAVQSCSMKCLRADDLFSTSSVTEDIWTYICKSKAIIADVTGRNANVFYEIGIAHTVGRPVILITQNTSDIPFDIAQFRYYLYQDDRDGWVKLSSSITLALTTIKASK